MKTLPIISLLIFLTVSAFSQKIPAYYSVGTKSGTIKSVKEEIKTKLKANNFKILGGYYPEGKTNNYVLVYTNSTLQAIGYSLKNYAIFGSVLRVALIKNSKGVEITFLNPEYFFRGYYMSSYNAIKTKLNPIETKVKNVFESYGELKPFGGSVSAGDLKKYHYMVGMPYYNEPVLLKEFESFEKGVEIIKANLAAKKGSTRLVYKLVYKKSKKAVFGVGLMDKTKGEPHFLPIIGRKNIAGLPYEIALIGNKAYMLHGRFRFAFYWPELSMGTFTKIMSTPGDVEDMMKALTK